MARSDTLPIFIDTYQFVREIYLITHKFPREFKYCLGEQMNRDVLQLLWLIFHANHQRCEKVRYLDDFLAQLEMVRVEIRLCHDMKVLSVRQLAHLALFMERIVKQANAWRKHQKQFDDVNGKEQEKDFGLPELNTTTG